MTLELEQRMVDDLYNHYLNEVSEKQIDDRENRYEQKIDTYFDCGVQGAKLPCSN